MYTHKMTLELTTRPETDFWLHQIKIQFHFIGKLPRIIGAPQVDGETASQSQLHSPIGRSRCPIQHIRFQCALLSPQIRDRGEKKYDR